MRLATLQIRQFRNLEPLVVPLHSQFNVFTGENGSGKTSLLEAIYFLAHGRSFRTNLLNRIIQEGQREFTLFAEIIDQQENHKLGVSRDREGVARIRFNGKSVNSSAEIASRLPILLFHPESFELLTGGTKGRRQLLDWGVFHLEPSFFKFWQDSRRIIMQRNATLKGNFSEKLMHTWDQALIPIAEEIDRYRHEYVELLKPVLSSLVGDFLTKHEVSLHYYRGWPKDQTLADVLLKAREVDQKTGHSHYGPHRADLRLRVGHAAAEEILSRGQQKLLICALKIAQGILLQQNHRHCIFLLDDIASELDEHNRVLLLNHLKNLHFQVFLTSIEAQSLVKYLPVEMMKIFTIKQGQINNTGSSII